MSHGNLEGMFGSSGRGRGENSYLPDPFCDFASTVMPESKSDVLRLCEYIWLTSGLFKTAMQRIVRYFLTKIEFEGDISDREKKRYEEFFYDQLRIMDIASAVGDDFLCYGNSFSSVYMPFNRILICGQCGLSRALDKIKKFTFDSASLEFKVVCPACKFDGTHEHKDLRSLDENRMHIIRWNPHEMEMLHNFITGETDFLWRVNRDIEGSIKKGRDFYLRTMPWEIIEAASKKKLFKFSKDACYHIYEPTISGVQNRGWGIPRMLGTFKDIYYVQLLKRYNEVLALDYVVPFRIVTPQKSGVADPMMHHDGNMFKRNLTEMLQEHRRNPTGYHILPFPVQYQTLSGEGVQLSPYQLIKQGTSDMMDSIGVPVELFQGNMSMQAAPTALRLFQATWPQFSTAINGWLTWVAQKVSVSFGWEEVRCKLQPVTYADDIERKGMLINLAAAQQISKRTAFAFLDVDPKEERRRMMQEQKDDLDIQKEFEEDQLSAQEMSDMTAAGGQPPQQPQGMPPAGYGGADPMAAGGMPPPQPMMGTGTPLGGGAPAATPEEVMNQSQQVAQQLMSMDESTRRSQMIQLKRDNPLLHAQVKQMMQDMRQQAGQQGVAAMNQQMQQGGGGQV